MRNARVDDNHAEVVAALRKIGCTVQSLATVGKGCPDLLVGWRGINLLLEVKDGSKSPSRRCLTPDEDRWIQTWLGQVAVVTSPQEAVEAVTKPA